ncbi:MAG: Na/Pi symporter [Bacteroidales bacterium]|nr:Na/Pi symporter [Bacteroidales bacterium]
METIGMIFCGLGLFFIGFRMISQNLRQLTGSRFRRMVGQATRNRFLSGLTGFVSGAVTQSAMASAFITTGFYSAGLLGFGRSLTIINWANIGTALLPFIVVLNIKVLVYYLIGLIGLAFFLHLDRTIRHQAMLQFLLGLALLFLGILSLKSASGPLQAMPWFRGALKMSSESIILLFLSGIGLTIAAQSGPTVTVVALSLASAGILPMPQTLVVVIGTGMGSAINILLLSSRLKGLVKQLCLYQSMFKFTGVIFVVLLVGLEYLRTEGGRHAHILSMITDDHGQQVACVFLIMQLLPALLLTAVREPVKKLIQRMSPVTAGDRLAEAEYINDLSLSEPETALYLVSREQMRLMRLLSDYLTQISPDRAIKPFIDQSVLHDGFLRLDYQITHYLDILSKQPTSKTIQEKMMETRQFSSLLHELEANLREFSVTALSAPKTLSDKPLTIQIIESLRTILDTSIESFENPDRSGLEIILSITADRGELLQQIRQDFIQKNANLDTDQRQSLYTMTILFDRVCWLLHKMTVIRLNWTELMSLPHLAGKR